MLAVQISLLKGTWQPRPVALCGVFAIIAPPWEMLTRMSANVARLDYLNLIGRDIQALAAVIATVTSSIVLIGYDCSVHRCKYTLKARKSLAKIEMLVHM